MAMQCQQQQQKNSNREDERSMHRSIAMDKYSSGESCLTLVTNFRDLVNFAGTMYPLWEGQSFIKILQSFCFDHGLFTINAHRTLLSILLRYDTIIHTRARARARYLTALSCIRYITHVLLSIALSLPPNLLPQCTLSRKSPLLPSITFFFKALR